MDMLIKDLCFIPNPLDTVNTTNHPSIFKLWKYLPVKMIQREQRLRGFKVSKHTHSMFYLGKLPVDLISKYGPELSKTLKLSLTELYKHDDWLFSYEYPRCTLVRWDKVKDQDWDIYQLMESNDLEGFISLEDCHQATDQEHYFACEGCFQMVGRKYDIPQLFRWIAGRLFGVPRSKWWIIPDLFKANKVCSVGVAYAYEYTRQKIRQFSGQAPWVRPFREKGSEVDIEATMPADYANSKSFKHAATNPAYR